MKILFGGTFDPVHLGHIHLALHISNLFQHPVDFLPLNGAPNYKPRPAASLNHRLAMLELVMAKYPKQLSIDYSESKFLDYSPTVATLNRLRLSLGSAVAIFFIIGSDSLLNLDNWDDWLELFNLTNFIVAPRPDYPLSCMKEQVVQQVKPRLVETYDPKQQAGQIIMLDLTPMPQSSTMIRAGLKQKVDVNCWLMPEVNQYIIKHNLYKGT